MFNPIQSQAALQNKARFPDKRIQQYASGPPQPTGQVTPPMAGEELAQRGAKRQAFQNQAAMQADPSNRPPVLAEKIMQLQQMEQALGVKAAMLAKKEQDLAGREQGIAALPMRPDMFTAMDGGIVFSGGGEVQRFAGGGSAANRAYRRALEKRIEDQETARTDLGFINEPYVDPFAGSPSTIKEDKAPNNKKPPSTVGPAGQAAPSRNELEDSITRFMGRMAPFMATPSDVSESRAGIRGALGRMSQAAEEGRPLEGKAREEMEKGERDRLAKEYEEYTSGRTGRREKIAEALRGQKPELIDYLGAMAEGGPGKTLAETLSRAVPGTIKLRAEQKAREMAAAKFMAEAEELDAKADLAERRGQTTAARAFSDQADQRRARGFEIRERAEKGTMQGLDYLAKSALDEAKHHADIAAKGYGAELEEGSRIRIAKATAKAQAMYREPNPTLALFNVLRDPKATDSDKAAAMAILGKGRQPHTPADEIKAQQFADGLSLDDPRLQKYLTPDVIKGIAAGGKNLKDPKLLNAVQNARNEVARNILSRSTTEARTAESILNLPSK